MYTHVCAHTYTSMHIRAHTWTFLYVYIYTQTRVCLPSVSPLALAGCILFFVIFVMTTTHIVDADGRRFFSHHVASAMMIDDWWLMIDDWWLMIDGWWFMIDDWWLMNDDWWLMIDEWLIMMISLWGKQWLHNLPRRALWHLRWCSFWASRRAIDYSFHLRSMHSWTIDRLIDWSMLDWSK